MQETSITIAVLIDALGWRLAHDHGFLREELPHRGPLATTFGDSSTCDSTILSGLKPREHGHFAFFTYDPENSPFKNLWWSRLLPKSLTRRKHVRHFVSRLARRYVGYTGYFRLYNTPFHLLSKLDYTEKQDLYAPHGINGGQRTLFDDLRSQNIPFYLFDGRLDEAANFAAAKRNIASGKPKFVYVFLSQLGNILHKEGTTSRNATAKIVWYEQQVRDLMKTAKQHYKNVTLSVFSDHGMTDIRKECALMQIVNSLPLEFGKDYFAVYDSTMARFWFLNDYAEKTIGRALECNPDGHWLSEETLESWGCDFPDRRFGDRFFLLKPGVLLNPSFMGNQPPAATNGFDPGHEDSVAFFATNQPKLPKPKGLEDLRRVLSLSIGLAA
jgi:hypothetical protein